MNDPLFGDDWHDAPPASGRKPWKILVVDDEPSIHTITELVLDDVLFRDRPLELISAYSAAETRAVLRETPDVACLILDVVMETDDAGLALVHWVRRTLGNGDLRIILRTGHPGQAPERSVILDYDINDYRTKVDLTSEHLFSAVIAALRSYTDLMDLRRIQERLNRSHTATIYALADLAEHRDTETGGHVSRVHMLSERTALAMGIPAPEAAAIGMAAALHDVGKVAVPDAVLHKPAKLDPDEWELMKQHTVHGAAALDRALGMVGDEGYLALAASVARHHHERFGGGGYPDGLVGEDIPLAARITAVTDVYDALLSHRPYKEPWPRETAVALLREGSPAQFDPAVVQAFLTVLEAPVEATQ